MDYLNLIKSLSLESFKADFVDARIEERHITIISLENHLINNSIKEQYAGIFIRVYNNGKWFYTSLNEISKDNIGKAIQGLIDLSSKSKGKKEPFYEKITAFEKSIFVYNENNPTQIPVKEKRELITHYDDLQKKYTGIKVTDSVYVDRYSILYYGNSKGRFTAYDYAGNMMRLSFMFADDKNRFRGSYKKYSNDYNGLLNLDNDIEQEINESERFLHAPTVKAGEFPVILSPMVAGVFAHESFGHKSEADFMLGDETMKKEWKIGKKVGSDILSIIDDGSQKGFSGYVPFDDEGNPAEKTYLIKNGILTGRLHSLITADFLEEEITGNGRAITTEFEPIVRMTSTYIDKGENTFEELVSDIDEGFYIDTFKHGSGLSTFTIAPSKAYKIAKGKIADPIKVNVITGNVFKTLNLIDGLSNKVTIVSSLIGGCGKVEQYPLRISFGGPEVRISKMNVS